METVWEEEEEVVIEEEEKKVEDVEKGEKEEEEEKKDQSQRETGQETGEVDPSTPQPSAHLAAVGGTLARRCTGLYVYLRSLPDESRVVCQGSVPEGVGPPPRPSS